MKRLVVVFVVLLLASGAAFARPSRSHVPFHSGGRSYHRGSSHSRYGLSFSFGSGYRYPSSYYSYYPSFGISYSRSYPAYYTYPSSYYSYAWPSAYTYPRTYSTVYTYPSTATYIEPAPAPVAPVAPAPPAPAVTTVQGWYHPTYGFHCQCHGFQKQALPNHAYRYDVSKDPPAPAAPPAPVAP